MTGVDGRGQRLPKVLWVYAYPHAFGGSLDSLLDTMRHRDRNAFEACAVLPAEGNVTREFEALGVRVHFLPPALAGKNLQYLRAVWAFRQFLKRERIDLVYFADYATWRPPGLVGAHLAHVPVVVHVRHVISDGLASDVWLRATRAIIGNARATLTALRGRVPNDKLRVIYGFVDFARFAPDAPRSQQFFPRECPLIGFVGMFRPEKGVEYFLDMAKRIHATQPEVRYVMAGGESLMTNQGWFEKMQRYADEIGIAHLIRFIGPRTDVPDIMRSFDLLVVPSLTEGCPRVVLEAKAAGTPVVATRVGGIPELIDDGVTGLLVPPRDPVALAIAVSRALADPQWRAQAAMIALQEARQRFAPARQVGALESVWREALGP